MPRADPGVIRGLLPCRNFPGPSRQVPNFRSNATKQALSLEEYIETLESAYLYAKTVTLGETHWPETNRVMLRNRRIGCSMSGLAQFITRKGTASCIMGNLNVHRIGLTPRAL